MMRTECWTKDGRTAMIDVEYLGGGEVVIVAYELLAQMMRDLGFEEAA